MSIANRIGWLDCEACNEPFGGPPDGAYSIALDDGDTADFYLCPACALTLAFEIAHGLDGARFDVLLEALQRQAVRREARV
jgi:hypothetical protein